MKKILILGSTGSIGRQALEVISDNPGLEAVGLAAGANHELIVSQARETGAGRLALVDEAAAALAEEGLKGESCTVYGGPGAIERLIEETECDLILNGIVGAAGLKATVAALKKGVTLALANKESLVAGGQFVTGLSREKNTQILPVDSEHSAIFQCLQGIDDIRELDRIYLTASGGPFLGRSRQELEVVTREEALSHPLWHMGSKVTVDSATLMNKGLEIIEAHILFGIPYDEIEV
ncbi:MAG: 1-deoxy-D-xylulose-5-phosphate reductoisomerase, partial [Actinomycetota bacterium]